MIKLQNIQAFFFSIASISHEEIDRVNIYQATIQSMFKAVNSLSCVPDYLLVDGLKLCHHVIPSLKIVKGDTLSQSIAAASILAKVFRDRLMEEYDEKWPQYGFKKNRGYGTQEHIAAIREFGPCAIHRRSFEPIKTLFLSEIPQFFSEF